MNQTDSIYADLPATPHQIAERANTIMRRVPVSMLDEPLNPMRYNMDDDAMRELMDDIRHNGLHQNLGVVPIMNGERIAIAEPSQFKFDAHEANGGRYRVAFGHRRLLALRGIFMLDALCKVFCDLSVSEQQIMHAENTKREEVTDYDLAVMYAEWCKEDGMTETVLCKRAGKSPEFVYARIELLNGWKEVADALHERKIKFSVARALNREEDEAYMKHFLNMAIDGGASSKFVNAWVSEHKALKDQTHAAGPAPAPGIHVTTAQTTKIECLICGDTQSYNLRTAMICQEDIDRVRAHRAAVDAAEGNGNVEATNS